MGPRGSFAPHYHPSSESPAFSPGAVGGDALSKSQRRAEPETHEAGGLGFASYTLCNDSPAGSSDGPAGDGGVVRSSWVQGCRCYYSRQFSEHGEPGRLDLPDSPGPARRPMRFSPGSRVELRSPLRVPFTLTKPAMIMNWWRRA